MGGGHVLVIAITVRFRTFCVCAATDREDGESKKSEHDKTYFAAGLFIAYDFMNERRRRQLIPSDAGVYWVCEQREHN